MEKQLKINNSRSLKSVLDAVIKENLKNQRYHNGLTEKDRQAKLAGQMSSTKTQGSRTLDEEDDTTEKPAASSKTVDDTTEKLQKGEVTTDDIVQKLNSIRGGRSFKDEDIASKLDEYIQSLTKAEKVALLAFLKGLTQIVTGEVPGEEALDPSDKDPAVTMKKKEKQKVMIKPVVIKAPKTGEKKKPSSEDTSGPVPITPKK
jgi:hypothetical protein